MSSLIESVPLTVSFLNDHLPVRLVSKARRRQQERRREEERGEAGQLLPNMTLRLILHLPVSAPPQGALSNHTHYTHTHTHIHTHFPHPPLHPAFGRNPQA